MSTEWVPSLWIYQFEQMVDEQLDYGDQWGLNFNYSQTNEVTNEENKRGWKVHCIFLCHSCRRTWPSARVVVLFRYRLRGNQHRGTVIMRPFRQACRECQNKEFILPGFSEDEVKQALLKLFAKIRKNCYGVEDGDCSGSTENVYTKPHEENLCEACSEGICQEE
uniref:3CxxC-type domain-containing protein n=1 Tax=Myripristis murdjan TaxID=586833 RepID=A0A667WTP9_9TELE